MKKARPKTDKPRVAAVPARTGLQPWHYWAALGAAFLAVCIVYWPAVEGPFVLDDLYLPFTAEEMANAPLSRWLIGVRPLLMFTFWINHTLSGMQTFSYHFLNLMLHTAAGAFAFLIVRKLLQRVGESGWKRDGLAAFAAGLFLLHPLQTESVAYIASRSETLSVMCFYAAFAVFLYRRREAIGWLESLAVLALFAAAASTKEHTAVLPALLLLTDLFWSSLRGVWRNWRVYALTAVAGAAALRMVWRILRSSDTAGFSVQAFTWIQYFWTQCRAVWFYLRLFVLPFGQNVDHDFAVSKTPLDHGAIFGLVALAAAVGAAIVYRRRYPLASYGFLVFLLLLAPTSSFIPINDVVAERRVYLPFIGLLLILVEFARRWKAPPRQAAAALSGVLLLMAVGTYNRSAVWSGAETLWTDAVSKSPHKARPHMQLGFAYFSEQRYDATLTEFEAAARYGPRHYGLLVDWAMADEALGRHDEAIGRLREATRRRYDANTFSMLGWAYLRAGRLADAGEALDTAERLNPRFAATYAYRGDLYAAQGNPSAALEQYRRALTLDPGSEVARDGLARLGAAR
jgi:predicted negative regulator of RcsB-dependent stress response